MPRSSLIVPLARRLCRASALLAAIQGGATVASAALWQGKEWAVIGTIAGRTGYDSNLTLSHNAVGDFFVTANPYLTLTRPNSSTDIRFNAGVTETEFIQGNQPRQTDLTFSAVYGYPKADNTIPIYRAEAVWQRSSFPNQYLGRRVQSEQSSIMGDGYLPLSGKLGVRANADYDQVEYKENDLNSNNRIRAFGGLAYQLRPTTETSLNIGLAAARSRPNRSDISRAPVRSNEIYFTIRARGEFTSKISGTVYGGFGQVKYKGGYVNNYNLPVAGADVTWGIDPRRTLVVAAYNGADYAPDGQSVNLSRALVSFTYVILGQWQCILRGGPSHAVFRREFKQRTDTAWDAGAELAYQPSARFRVAVAVSYTNQASDVQVNQFDRQLVSFETKYRF